MKPFKAYSNLVLHKPLVVLSLLALLALALLWFARDFRLDASADSLVVEGDPDLAFSREINQRYGTGEFVFVLYSPEAELFSEPVLDDLRQLRDELLALERVDSIDSIFSVPLFEVAGASLSDVADNIVTLEEGGLDLAAVRADLSSNEAYRDVLLSSDARSASLVVNFRDNATLQALTERRAELREAARQQSLDRLGRQELAEVEEQYRSLRAQEATQLHQDIGAIRAILDRHRDAADIHMGGVPMIADDLVTYVKRDLNSFGVAILVFIVAALWYFFRRWRYVVLPLLCGGLVAISMFGLLGLLDWPVTVISSNFLSLLLIITVSLTVHLIVRYRELQQESPGQDHLQRLRSVLASMMLPCAYTSLTTMVAFGSLVVSDIPPVIDFGLMMVLGVLCAFVLSFLLFPALMALQHSDTVAPAPGFDLTPAIGRFTERHRRGILLGTVLLLLAELAGLSMLKVENSFINYFDSDTEIYRGMVDIDERMGGTTPLDVIVTLSPPGTVQQAAPSFGDEDGWDDEDEFWEEEEEQGDPDAYWFTSDKMQTIVAMHEYLDSLEETGKVLSLATLLELAYELNDGRELNTFELGILYNRIPPEYKDSLLRPYVSVAEDQVRFSLRIRETDPDLRRSELLDSIRQGLVTNFNLQPEQVQLTGMLVLYNNMLESLFASQIETISVVMAVIFLMFVVLFRSLSLALIGIIPNLLAAMSVLGLMGLLGIPLDMMTITIAAVAIGIGVDNTIHYIHRFKHNFGRFGDYLHTMHYCHGSIGKAMYYTSFTIIAGFSILVLSNFVPTVYFGLLTSLAMLLALAGALTLLPLLILIFRPLGPETGPRS